MKTSLPIPRGAVRLSKPVKRKIAGWNEMTYDAKLRAFGVDWFRVEGGFGSQGAWSKPSDYLRDDWVADVPAVCVSVTVKDWHTPVFDRKCEYRSMAAAMRGKLAKGLEDARDKQDKALDNLTAARNAIELLTVAVCSKP